MCVQQMETELYIEFYSESPAYTTAPVAFISTFIIPNQQNGQLPHHNWEWKQFNSNSILDTGLLKFNIFQLLTLS